MGHLARKGFSFTGMSLEFSNPNFMFTCMFACCCMQDLFGVLVLKALSSGFCIGSCNWVLQSHYEKV